MNDYLILLLILFIAFIFYILVINLEKFIYRKKVKKRKNATYTSRRQRMREYNRSHRR